MTDKTYTFKAPIELNEALREVVYQKKFKNDSDFIRQTLMNNKYIKDALKKINNDKVQSSKKTQVQI